MHAPPRYPNLAAAIAIDGRPKYVIAADAGCTPNVISEILSGRADPTPETRAKFARALRKDPDVLFTAAATE